MSLRSGKRVMERIKKKWGSDSFFEELGYLTAKMEDEKKTKRQKGGTNGIRSLLEKKPLRQHKSIQNFERKNRARAEFERRKAWQMSKSATQLRAEARADAVKRINKKRQTRKRKQQFKRAAGVTGVLGTLATGLALGLTKKKKK